jgi:hypothetical protein
VPSQRPVPWAAPALYGAVLVAGLYAWVAGLYAWAAGLGTTRPALFVGGLAALVPLDLVERRGYPLATPPAPAVVLLLAIFMGSPSF